ncbi:MAG: head decoration protein [Thermoanaerobacter sp.]|nr:head decoration protein [Thermoanaerobacter sp.]
MDLYTKQADSVTYDNLIAGTSIPLEIKSVTLKAGQGVIKRGTVLGIITASGLAVPVNSANTDGSQSADCILTDDVDTGDAGATTNVVATAYSSGLFNRKALIFGGTDTAANHETRLRELGIFLKDNIPY